MDRDRLLGGIECQHSFLVPIFLSIQEKRDVLGFSSSGFLTRVFEFVQIFREIRTPEYKLFSRVSEETMNVTKSALGGINSTSLSASFIELESKIQ